MLEQLFSSRVRAGIVAAFFLLPGERFSASDLSRRLDETYSAVWKELSRLEQLGILRSETQGRSKYFEVDESCPIAPELRSMVLKTAGIGPEIGRVLGGMPEIDSAFIFGPYADGTADAASDIDLMIIGELELEALSSQIASLELTLGRSINYLVFSKTEWSERLREQDPFVENVSEGEKIMLIGEPGDL